jgi:heat shock protein HtpX
MVPRRPDRRSLAHGARTAALTLGIAALLVTPAWWLGGPILAAMVVAGLVSLLIAVPAVPLAAVLRLLRTRPLTRWEAPGLHADLDALSDRAGLPSPPALHLLPDARPNALAMGVPGDAAIAVSAGLLRVLDRREIAAVLAHEVSHVRNLDTRTMLFAQLAVRMTRLVTSLGLLLLWIALPLALFGVVTLDLATILVLAVAPGLAARLQLALSRTREYAADHDAARLLGDPRPLADALRRLDRVGRGWLATLPWPIRPAPADPLGGTHPPLRERVRRLLESAPPARPPVVTSRPARVVRLPGGILVRV